MDREARAVIHLALRLFLEGLLLALVIAVVIWFLLG